ncbi:hypothetical protein PY793_06390 [Acetobacter fabarum]|uniref:hypothetical protein n=1 Tax=Acetobacter fabarum TaxID=483199 RepID=UPI00312B7197
MKYILVFLYCVNFSPAIAKTKDNFPDDVIAFFHDADVCQYLAGEWDDSLPQKRKNELSYEMDRSCLRIYEKQKYFGKKYFHNKIIIQKLKSYEF